MSDAAEFSVQAVGLNPSIAPILERTVRLYFKYIANELDISRLDAVTLAADYDKALLEVDRGVAGAAPLTRSNTDYAQGVAMAVPVLRDGFARSHIVLNAQVVFNLATDDSFDGLHPELLYLLAHELGHVHHLQQLETAFPGRILQAQYPDYRSSLVGSISQMAFEEYSVCRVTAGFSHSLTESGFTQVFIASARAADNNCRRLVEEFHEDNDSGKVLAGVAAHCGEAINFASYLLGQMHGTGSTVEENRELRQFLSRSTCSDLFEAFGAEFDSLFVRYGKWGAISDFSGLEELVEEAIAEGGVLMEPAGELGVRVHVRIP